MRTSSIGHVLDLECLIKGFDDASSNSLIRDRRAWRHGLDVNCHDGPTRLDAILSSTAQRPTPTPALTPARASTLFVPVEDAWPILAAHLPDEPKALFG